MIYVCINSHNCSRYGANDFVHENSSFQIFSERLRGDSKLEKLGVCPNLWAQEIASWWKIVLSD